MKKISSQSSDAVPVRCAHTRMVPVSELKPYPRNPIRHPENQIALLSRIIREQGWRNPIVVSNLSGYIVKGHGRYQAAVRLGLKTVPVDFQDYPSESMEKADRLADNAIENLREDDWENIRVEMADLDTLLGDDIFLTAIELPEVPLRPKIHQLETKAPPKMSWVLIGLPLERHGEITDLVERAVKVSGAIIKSCVSDKEN